MVKHIMGEKLTIHHVQLTIKNYGCLVFFIGKANYTFITQTKPIQ